MNTFFLIKIYIEFSHRLLARKNEMDAANIKWRLDEAATQLGLIFKKSQQGLHHEV